MARYTDDDLLTMLQAVAAELGHPPSASEMNAHDDTASATTYQARFGSWNDALRAAGLETAGYSDDDLCQLLEELAAQLDRRPTADDIAAREDLPNLSTFQDHFGSWNAALEAADLGINQVYAYDEDALRAELAHLTRSLGRVASERDMDETGRYSANAYRTQFG
jgi:hypothetical protein